MKRYRASDIGRPTSILYVNGLLNVSYFLKINRPKITFTIHGEGNNIEAYASSIRERLNWNVVEPEYQQTVQLFSGI